MYITTNYQINHSKYNVKNRQPHVNPTFGDKKNFIKDVVKKFFPAVTASTVIAIQNGQCDTTAGAQTINTEENILTYEPAKIEKFFKDANIKFRKNRQTGFYEIGKFNASDEKYKQAVEKHGINENKLFENIIKIEGDARFEGSELISLGKVECIGGCAFFKNSKIKDLGNLKVIGTDANFFNSQITNLGTLEKIGGYALFSGSKITNLGNLEIIGRDAHFVNSKIISLGKLNIIGRDAYFNNSKVVDLGKLEYIGRNAFFGNSKITSLKNLKYIMGNADFRDSEIKDIEDLQVKGNIHK